MHENMLFWTSVCACTVAALLLAERRQRRAWMWLSKPIASTCFLLVAWTAGALESGFGLGIFAGLVLSWCGDVFLISRTRAAFLAGLVAFLAGHLAYVIAFVLRGVSVGWGAAATVAVGAVALLVGRWLLPWVKGSMRGPVVAYIVVISLMVASAVGTFALHGGAAIVVGALAFYLSDLAVARDRFVASSFLNRAWGLPLYYGGQLTLAWAVAWT